MALLQITSGAPSAATLTVVNGATDTGYNLLGGAEFGNAVWEHAFSGPRGTQGARAAQGVPQNRPLVLPLRVSSTTKDGLAALTSTLQRTMDEVRRFGGTVKWQSNNATSAVYFDVMAGTAGVSEWGHRAETRNRAILIVEASCAPYLKDDPLSAQAFAAEVLPQTLELDTVTGDAPALMDIKVACSGGSAAPVFALIGWTKRPSTPLAGSVAPFGVIEAETGASLSTWAVTADADYRGGSSLQATAAGVGTASALFAVDPSTMTPDDYTQKELDLEVWARVELASTLVSPKLILSAEPTAGTSFGQVRYSNEWGSTGKLLVLPSSGTRFRFVRVGTLRVVADPGNAVKWNLKLAASWAAGSSGTFGFDYLCVVPARARACSPTGKALDSSYPKFIASTADTRKTVRSDLSALTASAANVGHPDHGLGGALLELPVGDVDVFVKLSSLVPDDPTSDATTEQEEHAADVTCTVTPRWHFLATV